MPDIEAALRTDARRNRQALVTAAWQVFGEEGLQAPLDEIARRAGVGNATLYRRFPSRCDLVAAVFADRLEDHIRALEAALAHPDPWLGFRQYVEFVCGLQAADRGLADLLTMSIPDVPQIERLRVRAYRGFVELARRAQAAGALRQDFVPEDLVLLLMANAGLIHRTRAAAPDAWRRFLALFLDGARAEAATPAPTPPDPSSMELAMLAQADSLGRLVCSRASGEAEGSPAEAALLACAGDPPGPVDHLEPDVGSQDPGRAT